jgi:hypothetical protein
MTMFALDPSKMILEDRPFPHAVIDGVFAPETFVALAQCYPQCPPASGPTGHTIHRGDAGFDAVMAAQPLWRELFTQCNSQGFVDRLAAPFAAEIDRACVVPRAALRFADHIETRAEKETSRIANPALPAEQVFVRFDFMQGMESYTRAPHLDHRRRLATMLIYFDAPGPDTFRGGDLVLHDGCGDAVKRIPPAANQAMLFACSDRSWHSVEAVSECRRPRRFLQISVSSCHDLWPRAELPARGPLEWGRRLVRGLVRAA